MGRGGGKRAAFKTTDGHVSTNGLVERLLSVVRKRKAMSGRGSDGALVTEGMEYVCYTNWLNTCFTKGVGRPQVGGPVGPASMSPRIGDTWWSD